MIRGAVAILLVPWATVGLLGSSSQTAEFSNPAPIKIPGASSSLDPGPAKPYPSSIEVSGVSGPVKKVRVTLNGLGHREVKEVDVLLVGPPPASKKVILMAYISQNSHTELKGATYTFDDSAAAKLPKTGDPPASGTFKPTSYRNHAQDPKFVKPAPKPPYGGLDPKLADFNGTDPNGVWKLYVMDTLGSYDGEISGGWKLEINGAGGGPPPSEPACFGRKATITGKGEIKGTEGKDVIVGSARDDEIRGLGGDDIICGEGGKDELRGNAGHDVIDGGDGKDSINGGAGNDAMHGRGAADFLHGDTGNDWIWGKSGNDKIRGAAGDDLLYGESGRDDISGGSDSDFLSGGPHGDLLAGGKGTDEVLGGGGFDRCTRADAPNDAISCEEILNP